MIQNILILMILIFGGLMVVVNIVAFLVCRAYVKDLLSGKSKDFDMVPFTVGCLLLTLFLWFIADLIPFVILYG